MNFLYLLVPLIFALPSTSLFILLPLYVYPGTNAVAWNSATAAIKAYPNVQWQVIVNPNSGPGTTGYPTDANIITGISNLNKYTNVKTLGYVDTNFTNRAYSAVVSDINVYASWAGYSQANISIDGIFFDDVNNNFTQPTSGAVATYMQNASSYAYATVPSDITPVVFNPGSLAPTQLFSYCDTMVEFENPFSVYKNDTTIKTISSAYRDQSAILVYDTPGNANIASLVHTMVLDGIEAVYFTNDCCYQSLNATELLQLAAAVNAG